MIIINNVTNILPFKFYMKILPSNKSLITLPGTGGGERPSTEG